MKRLTLALFFVACLGSVASACDRQRILAVGGGCYAQQAFVQPLYQPQAIVIGGNTACQEFIHAQPIYAFRRPRVNINIGNRRSVIFRPANRLRIGHAFNR